VANLSFRRRPESRAGINPAPYEGCRFIRQILQNAKIPRPRRGGLYALPKNSGITGGGKPRPYEGCRFIRQILQNAKIPRRGGLYALPKNEALCPPFFGSPASGALLRSESPHPSFPRRPESTLPSFPRRPESTLPSFPRRPEFTLPSFPCRSESTLPSFRHVFSRNPERFFGSVISSKSYVPTGRCDFWIPEPSSRA